METTARRPVAVTAQQNPVLRAVGATYRWLKTMLTDDTTVHGFLVGARLLAEVRHSRAERDLYR
jgi:hypothetical protein